MLSIEDGPTIYNAIMKRLHVKGKTEIVDIKILARPDQNPPNIQVSIWAIMRDMIMDGETGDGLIDTRSFFDLPWEFSHAHLLNEIDEVAEQIKDVRKKAANTRLLWQPGKEQPRAFVIGTGLRGRWAKSLLAGASSFAEQLGMRKAETSLKMPEDAKT